MLARREVQDEMNTQHEKCVDHMYSNRKFDKEHKFTLNELEEFLNEHLGEELNKEKVKCLFVALDRDQDNLIAHHEFCDAIFGAE